MANDRGWNDPPTLTYQSTATSRHVLSRRPHQMPGFERKSQENGPAMIPTSLSGPPLAPPIVTQPPKPVVEAKEHVGQDVSLHTGSDVTFGDVVNDLEVVFENLKSHLDTRPAGDVRRRLGILKTQWESGVLSKPVVDQMSKLVTALEAGDGEAAHLVHVALMVNHVTEVSQWMVGVKRLIVTVQQQHTKKSKDSLPKVTQNPVPNGLISADD